MMRRLLALGLAAAIGLATAGCSGEESKDGKDGKAAGGDKGTIYLVSKGFQHRFWQAVKEGAEKAGKETGYKVEFVGPDNEQQVTQQLDQLRTAMQSQPQAIGIAALDSGAAAPLLEEIKAANIPVVAFDSGVESDIPLTTVATDNKKAAAEAAKKMVEIMGDTGKVATICHDQTSATGKERCEGFREWMKDNAPNITLLDEQYAGEVNAAAGVAKSILEANPDVKGVYGSNEAAAIGALQGVKEVGKTKDVTLIGFDSGKAQLEAVRDGSEAGAITQSPVKMGYETVMAAVKAIKGEKLEKKIDSGFAYYDKNNIDDPQIKENLYE